ncbi:hypothetical protein [Candidatus Magnetobacterium casense]|uniref:TadE-like protein n=1 Tax=Candidatus Magnetobacterium casense TaxID=1455061 RepID=A0ABS6S535_9BACT|nr:hypothetical protein [Candidatus Magnetobacterium casensis]MBV6343568.1 hypothetical protein [Candidatus Magnetobacterium casensis]
MSRHTASPYREQRCLNCELGCLLLPALVVIIPMLLIGEVINDLCTLYYRLSDWRRRHVVADAQAKGMGV